MRQLVLIFGVNHILIKDFHWDILIHIWPYFYCLLRCCYILVLLPTKKRTSYKMWKIWFFFMWCLSGIYYSVYAHFVVIYEKKYKLDIISINKYHTVVECILILKLMNYITYKSINYYITDPLYVFYIICYVRDSQCNPKFKKHSFVSTTFNFIIKLD